MFNVRGYYNNLLQIILSIYVTEIDKKLFAAFLYFMRRPQQQHQQRYHIHHHTKHQT